MLLFNIVTCVCATAATYISKHPMLLFNVSSTRISVIRNFISKHPMLLFNPLILTKSLSLKLFQNILCYCLTRSSRKLQLSFQISKHPMLLFNWYLKLPATINKKISKHPMLLFNCSCTAAPLLLAYFKTSYVTV